MLIFTIHLGLQDVERRADLAHQAYGLRGAGGFPLVGGGRYMVGLWIVQRFSGRLKTFQTA